MSLELGHEQVSFWVASIYIIHLNNYSVGNVSIVLTIFHLYALNPHSEENKTLQDSHIPLTGLLYYFCRKQLNCGFPQI